MLWESINGKEQEWIRQSKREALTAFSRIRKSSSFLEINKKGGGPKGPNSDDDEV